MGVWPKGAKGGGLGKGPERSVTDGKANGTKTQKSGDVGVSGVLVGGDGQGVSRIVQRVEAVHIAAVISVITRGGIPC